MHSSSYCINCRSDSDSPARQRAPGASRVSFHSATHQAEGLPHPDNYGYISHLGSDYLNSKQLHQDWTMIEPGTYPPQDQYGNNTTFSLAPDQQPDQLFCIFADLLIPGRGAPFSNAAVGLSIEDGSITFVGPQSSIPNTLASAPRTHVRYLLPGLWDCHTHFMGTTKVDFPEIVQTHPATCGAAVTRDLHQTLMAGFTSVRDVGSYVLEVAPLVKAGIILGPNIFAAGASIGITGGSCDGCTLPADFVYSRQGTGHERPHAGVCALAIADGVEECRLAVRQQIRRGAQCIKVLATGGVMSTTDNPHYRQYSDAELVVLIEEASLQRRSVAVHAHGQEGIIAAIKAGAHTIEHGSYLDEEAADLMVSHGVTFVSTRHVVEAGLRNLNKLNPEIARKMVEISKSHMKSYELAVRKGVKIALGTDMASSDPESDTAHGHNGNEVVYAIKAGLTPLQAIEAGTANSAETLGALAPKKGIIKVGWDADMIAFDENPLENIGLFANPENVKYVWKGALMVKSPGRQMLWPPRKPSQRS